MPQKIDSMEQQSSQLKNELSGINQDLLELGSQIADLEDQIKETNNQIEATQAQIDIAKNSEQQQFEEMKLRIKYVYENDSASMLSMIFSVDNMADFLNRVEFVQNVSDYDREQLEELCTLRETIEEEEAKLQDEERFSGKKWKKELADQKEELNAKAEATSTDLAALSDKIASLRAEEAAKQAKHRKHRHRRRRPAEIIMQAQAAARAVVPVVLPPDPPAAGTISSRTAAVC